MMGAGSGGVMVEVDRYTFSNIYVYIYMRTNFGRAWAGKVVCFSLVPFF